MKVVVIDYGSGNLRSAAKAFEKAGLEAGLAEEVLVTGDADQIRSADRIVLPGVGAYADCKRGLAALDGMIEALNDAVLTDGKPFLGICVGMQLMAKEGREHGTTEGLGWIDGVVDAITPVDPSLKIPHMGWNALQFADGAHPVLDGISPGSDCYFVHSYAMTCQNPADVLATVDYAGPITAIIGKDNMVGTQFHPEKSQSIGLHLIANFLKWSP